jgi:hypothetical protein
MTTPPEPRDVGNWAEPVERMHVGDVAPGGAKGGVEGLRPTSPLQGFGQMWQKTYEVVVGKPAPEEVIRTWKAHYGDFWPSFNRFYAPVAGLKPGEVALIKGGMGPVKLSTGVRVIYADDTSFAYMTPEGSPFSGFITFSSFRDSDNTKAQVQLLIRASDPITEIGFMVALSRIEDRIWTHMLQALAARFGSQAEITKDAVKVDARREWKNWKNVWNNPMFRWARPKR